MKKLLIELFGLLFLAGIARGLTTDNYYSVQNGYWDQASTWTSSALVAFGYPRTGDTVYIYHNLMITSGAACMNAVVTGQVSILPPGEWDIYQNARFDGAYISGSGPFKTWGDTILSGTMSYVSCPWFKAGLLLWIHLRCNSKVTFTITRRV